MKMTFLALAVAAPEAGAARITEDNSVTMSIRAASVLKLLRVDFVFTLSSFISWLLTYPYIGFNQKALLRFSL